MTRQPCPACPDGNEWNSDGPTGRACRTCGGTATVNDEEFDRPDFDDLADEYAEEQMLDNRSRSKDQNAA